MTNFFSDLQKRGLIYQVTDESLYKDNEKLNFYCGFDPTSDSLHLGSLLPLLTMRRFQQEGFKPILLMGGGTGLIGDPSGKSQERILLSEEIIAQNIQGIQKIASRFLNFEGSEAAIVVNNLDWLKEINTIEFLREVGKHFTVNSMLAKDSVRSRLEDRDQGISFTEFSYMLLQGYDYFHLHENHHCELQIGGSDQWGNITAGIELIRRKSFLSGQTGKRAFGLTLPLVIKADGQKFGKSESGTLWLDKEKTSPYQMYQFLLRTSDEDVEKYLKYFSFKSLSEVEEVIQAHRAQPELRIAQKSLADEMVQLIHGEQDLKRAQESTKTLFSGNFQALTEEEIANAFENAPSLELSLDRLESSVSLVDLLVETRLCSSKGNARKDILGGGISVNGTRAVSTDHRVGANDLLAGNRLVLQKGKKTYFLIEFK